jgi:hypothetical protein
MLFLVISTPRPERPSEVAVARQSFWPWISAYRNNSICRHIYPRIGRGAVAVFDVESNNDLHRILNEWADIIAAHFDTYPASVVNLKFLPVLRRVHRRNFKFINRTRISRIASAPDVSEVRMRVRREVMRTSETEHWSIPRRRPNCSPPRRRQKSDRHPQ